MSENKHTPEPWRTDAECGFPQDIHDSKGNLFLSCGSDFYNEVYGEANARRITACVNACEGIPTDALERSKSLDEFMRSMKVIEQQRDSFKDDAEYNKRRAEDAEKQRDELLAALEGLVNALDSCIELTPERIRAAVDAIESVKGEQ